MRKATLTEIMDPNSDFHVERYAEEAQRHAASAIKIIEISGSPILAGGAARFAAREGVKALEIIERRGTDDLELFCAKPLPIDPPTPPNATARPLQK